MKYVIVGKIRIIQPREGKTEKLHIQRGFFFVKTMMINCCGGAGGESKEKGRWGGWGVGREIINSKTKPKKETSYFRNFPTLR